MQVRRWPARQPSCSALISELTIVFYPYLCLSERVRLMVAYLLVVVCCDPGLSATQLNMSKVPAKFYDMELEFDPDGTSKAITRSCTRVILKDVQVPVKDCSKVVSELLNTYAWERKCQIGQLVSIHRNGLLCAYTFRTKLSSFIRVINVKEKTRSNPTPIKNQVVHIAWAFSLFPPTVGVIDIYAEMFFFHVGCNEKFSPILTPWLTVNRELSVMCGYPLFSWCPYAKREQLGTDVSEMELSEAQLPDSAAGNYASMIVATVGQQAQVMILSQIVKEKGSTVAYSKERCAACVITEESVVTYACLSPDGTALSLSTEAGLVKLYILESFADVRRAHQWYPHGQKPVTTIVFLDSLCSVIPSYTTDVQFWKTAITSAEGNRELYLWECDSWQRTSAVEIPATPETADNLSLFISNDAHFAIVSDVRLQLLYIFEIIVKAAKPRFCHFAYVCLFQPIISLDIKELRVAETNNANVLEEPNKEAITGFLIAINPKSLLSLTLNIEKALPEEESITNGSEESNASIEGGEDRKNGANPIIPADEKGEETVVDQQVPDKPENREKEALVPPSPDLDASLAVEDANQVPMELKRLFMESMNENFPDVDTEILSIWCVTILGGGDRCVLFIKFALMLSSQPACYSTQTLEATHDVTESFTASCDFDLFSCRCPLSAERDLAAIPLAPETEDTSCDQESKELASLKALIVEQGKTLSAVMQRLQRIEEKEMQVTKCLDDLKEILKAANEKQSNVLNGRDQLAEKAIASALMNAMSMPENGFARIVRREVQGNLLQAMSKMLMNNRQQIDRNLQKTFQCFKGEMQEGFGAVYEKRLADNISSKISGPLIENMNACFRNTFMSILIPAFDKSVQKLFDNVNAVFQEGTQEYFEQLTVAQDSASDENSHRMLDMFTDRVAGMGQEIRGFLNKQLFCLVNSLKENLKSRDSTELESIRASVSSALAKVVKEQIAICMEENKAVLLDAIRHAAVGSATYESPARRDPRLLREMVAKMVENEMYVEAFAQAINSGDPLLVTYVCSLVEVRKVFDSNHTLLSVSQSLQLVHLLASSLSEEEIQLKLKYILAALAALDESATDVNLDLAILEANYVMDMLKQYSDQNPNSSFAGEIRVINLVAKAIANKKSP
ncbi:hypothetical protein M513_05945 [Trichuris suis]|uniref:Uncharacterized protein n=1 Tax=Trichuris suis TaxID=68888 RepID=A0A085M7N9_9BILA|nr:hypothetical protein M513_05945 [Trichuris suis]